MPGGNGTGPAGMGPMTGRAAGFCAGYSVPGYANPIPGRGFGGYGGFGRGRGGGMGMGRRNQFYATGLTGWQRAGIGAPAYGVPQAYPATFVPPTREVELDTLKAQAEYLEDSLDGVRKQIEELQAKSKQD